jgi:4-amino-4-deoxy-L-arabinose transferase-like glycosyltransferase
MTKLATHKAFWLLLIIACITILPFLGLADFHTKGEPREAVVAYTMLDGDNWVLPRNNGGEIPYKPPFFHWCIAATSAALNGGVVNEFTSRFPSAVALIAMVMGGFLFYSRRKGVTTGLLTAMVTLTAFEIHRAGANCRVDMMLTALTVGALYLFYRWWERGLKGLPWIAILLMSCGTLTKGPVGSIIPCLVMGVFMLLRGERFVKTFALMVACGLLSFIVPLAWYVAAYQQGGQEFLDLVMEENFGRMTSTMAYDSCVNPWPFNFATLAAGYVPWILLVLFSLFTLTWSRLKPTATTATTLKAWLRSLPERVRRMDAVNLLSLLAIVVIFVFYCIPQSKRSVYLMPIYPFIAYFLARYMQHLVEVRSAAVKVYGSLLAVVGVLLTALFAAIKAGMVPYTIFHGHHAAQNIAMMQAIANIHGVALLPALLPLVLAVAWFVYIARNRAYTNHLLYGICALTFGLYIALDGAYQPPVLNVKSVRPVAADINAIAPASAGTLYEYIHEAEIAKGDPIHFFEVNFYLDNRIQNFLKERPANGFLLMVEGDAQANIPRFEADGYSFTELHRTSRPIFGQTGIVYRFTRQ